MSPEIVRPRPRVRQAVVLVGGKGTRLGDLTKTVPKPLMPIGGDRVFLDLLIDNLARQGFDRVLLLAGYLGEQVRDRYDGKIIRSAHIEVLIEDQPLGTGGALKFAAPKLEDRFLLSNGDTFFDTNYRALEQALDAHGGLGAMALCRVPDASRYGTVDIADDGTIESFVEKADGNNGPGLINAGTYLLSRGLIELLPDGASSLEGELFPRLLDGKLVGVADDRFFIDIGLPETLARACLELPDAIRRPAAFLDRDGVLNRDHGYVHRWDQFDWIDGAKQAIRYLNDNGYFVLVVTNQAGVAHGYYNEDAVHALHEFVRDALAEVGAFIDAFYHCPFHPDAKVGQYRARAHQDRKPAPGMILRGLSEWPIQASRSFLVGDRATDIAAAEAAGIKAALFEGGSLLDFVVGSQV